MDDDEFHGERRTFRALVDTLNTVLLAGQLSAAAKTNIVNYVTNTANFPFSTPPTANADARPRPRRGALDRQLAGLHHPKMNTGNNQLNTTSNIRKRSEFSM